MGPPVSHVGPVRTLCEFERRKCVSLLHRQADGPRRSCCGNRHFDPQFFPCLAPRRIDGVFRQEEIHWLGEACHYVFVARLPSCHANASRGRSRICHQMSAIGAQSNISLVAPKIGHVALGQFRTRVDSVCVHAHSHTQIPAPNWQIRIVGRCLCPHAREPTAIDRVLGTQAHDDCQLHHRENDSFPTSTHSFPPPTPPTNCPRLR